MFQIIQSNDTDELVNQLIHFYEQNQQYGLLQDSIFRPFTVIVPSVVLGDWLSKQVAVKAGISTLLTAQFWGQYQWQMIDKVLKIDARINDDGLAVPEVAVLSGSVMRWRIFGFLSQIVKVDLQRILDDETNVLHFLFKPLADTITVASPDKHSHFGQSRILEQRLWQACDELAKVYVRYLTHRPEWLHAWGVGKPLPVAVDDMIRQKDKFADSFGQENETPEWLFAHYNALEKLLRYLWQALFSEVYEYRERLEERFWQVLDGKRGKVACATAIDEMPKELYLFTVQTIPQVELMFLKRLSSKINVRLFHLNPSKMFWADIVDKNWLLTQQIIKPHMVYLKDFGHGLLSRLGKESRETFAMLADMSGGEFYYEQLNDDWVKNNQNSDNGTDDTKDLNHAGIKIDWQDKFIAKTGNGILQKLKQDILMLGVDDGGVAMGEMLSILTQKTHQKPTLTLHGQPNHALQELSIHACHSLKRQLEIARTMIAKYLNTDYGDGVIRQLSDVVILLPDVENAQNVIRSVFVDGVGVDGLRLPIKITGVSDRTIDELMQAIIGFYRLLGEKEARFYAQDFFEWLMNPSIYENFNLTFDDAYRARELLMQAGFKRGFDARHISTTLHDADTDYRYTFSYALDRIVMGFIAPDSLDASEVLHPFDWIDSHNKEATLPIDGIGLNDTQIVVALCAMREALLKFSDDYQRIDTVQAWLQKIEHEVIDGYFYGMKQTVQMRAIFEAKNAMMSSLRANVNYHKQIHDDTAYVAQDDICLSLEFVLESLAEAVGMQAIAAEPSGVITVARFGALRSIPFGLTLMLGMNLSAFPRQDNNFRLDLMRAGLKRRGDRTNEDDDNGAFLDAVLCTKDACAIFYDGISADGNTVLLPASPVGELIEFFKADVDWQLADIKDENVQSLALLLPNLIERYLVTYHHAMSFEEGVFYENRSFEIKDDDFFKNTLSQLIDNKKREQKLSLPPAPIWQQVRQIIDDQKSSDDKPFVILPSDDEVGHIANILVKNNQGENIDEDMDELFITYRLNLPNYLTAQTIANVIKSPIRHYLRGKFAIDDGADDDQMNEPLSLDGLGNWQLCQMIAQVFGTGVFDGRAVEEIDLKQLSNNKLSGQDFSQEALMRLSTLYHDSLLPAGVVRWRVLQDGIGFVGKRFLAFFDVIKQHALASGVAQPTDFSAMMTTTHEQVMTLNMGQYPIKVVASVPMCDETLWLNLLVSRASADKLIGFWVHHLIWQIHRKTTQDDVVHGRGASIWQYQGSSSQLNALKLKSADTYQFAPMLAEVAKRYLVNLVLFVLIGAKLPIALMPLNALIIAKAGGDMSQVDINGEWVDELVALVIGDISPDEVLSTIGRLSVPLYETMLQQIKTLDSDS